MPGARARSLITGLQGGALLAVAIFACAAMTSLAWRPVDFTRQALPFVALYGVLFAAFLLGLRWLASLGWRPRSKVVLILLVAVALRMILLPAPPLLDDDIYRYRWDGKVLAHGANPYAYPPESSMLASLSMGDPLYERIAFRDIPAVYPPASMALFAAGYRASPDSIWGIKVLVVLSEGLIFFALLGLLKAFGQPQEAVALYAWNPLVLKEFANSGHHDAAGIALLMLGLWAVAANRRAAGAVGLALAALVKPIILVAVPALWSRLRPAHWLLAAALIAAAYLPFAGIGLSRLFEGTALYARHWEMNDSVFALVQAAFGGPVPTARSGFLFETNPAARAVVLLILALIAAYMIHDGLRERAGLPLRFGPAEGGSLRSIWRVAILIVAVLALTPTMDPWYLCWLVPFLCLLRWEAGLLMTGTVGLSYLYYWQGQDLWWIRPLEYMPVVCWAFWEIIRSRRTALQPARA